MLFNLLFSVLSIFIVESSRKDLRDLRHSANSATGIRLVEPVTAHPPYLRPVLLWLAVINGHQRRFCPLGRELLFHLPKKIAGWSIPESPNANNGRSCAALTLTPRWQVFREAKPALGDSERMSELRMQSRRKLFGFRKMTAHTSAYPAPDETREVPIGPPTPATRLRAFGDCYRSRLRSQVLVLIHLGTVTRRDIDHGAGLG